jgi:hypothetical protein
LHPVLGHVLLCFAQSGVLALFGWLAWLLHRRAGLSLRWAAPVGLMAAEHVFPLIFPFVDSSGRVVQKSEFEKAQLGERVALREDCPSIAQHELLSWEASPAGSQASNTSSAMARPTLQGTRAKQ